MNGNNIRYWMILSTGLLLCAGQRTAWAQSAADKAAADALFNEGRKLISKGDTAAACEKFEASLQKLTQLGTQIALASCYEKLGKTASAWGAFRTAASVASKLRDKRQRFAEARAAALDSKLSKIMIMAETDNHVDGLEIKRDGFVVTRAEFGIAVPVDPGDHIIEARAPGRVAWSITVSVPSTSDVVEVALPVLEKLPVAGRLQRHRRTIAYSIGGGGIAIIGASLIFGAVARSRWNDAQEHCDARLCDQPGLDLAGSARTLGNVSTATFVVGAAAVVTAVGFLLIVSPANTERALVSPQLRVVPHIGTAQLGLTLQGGF